MMDLGPWDEVIHGRQSMGLGGRFYGVYPAEVVDIADPDGQGRVKIRLPWSPDANNANYEAWARLATFMAGNGRGSWFIPDVGDEVLICFQAGDVRHPFMIGGLWNGRDAPPASMDGAGRNEEKTLKSRNGVVITIQDKDGQESISIETPGGQILHMKDGPGEIEIRDSNGNEASFSVEGISVRATPRMKVDCSGPLEISAAIVTVNAGMSRFSGTVQADTILTNSVISASYTPGAGNIW